MPYHIIIKNTEFEVVNKFPSAWRMFIVREEASNSEHWHCWLDTDMKQDKVRRELDKIREKKVKGVSVRPWDNNLVYFCKGLGPTMLPVVIRNDNVVEQEEIIKLNEQWWSVYYDKPELNPDIKPTPILEELIEMCRDKEMTPDDVIKSLIDIYIQRNGKKMLAIKSTGQAYVRTALCFTKDGKKYQKMMHQYYKNNLFY